MTGYRVEKREESSKKWTIVEEISAFDTVYKVSKLKENVGIFFAVAAKKKIGYA